MNKGPSISEHSNAPSKYPAFNESLLVKENVTEQGETLCEGRFTLARIPDIEAALFAAELEIVQPNPDQPRQYFDPKKMKEIRASILSEGQEHPIVVVPVIDNQDGKMKLFIVDGERRFRSLKDLKANGVMPDARAKVEVTYAATEYELFKKSLTLNEVRADHNAIERAEAWQKMVNFELKALGGGRQKTKAMQNVAGILGVELLTVINTLRLLELPDKVKKFVMENDMPSTAALEIARNSSKYKVDGESIVDELKKAAIIIENPEMDFDEQSVGTSIKDVQAATKRALISGGREDLAHNLTASKAVGKLMSGSSKLIKGESEVEGIEDEVVKVLRNRKEPPEVLRDKLENARNAITALLDGPVADAIAPPPLENMDSKPDMAQRLSNKTGYFKKPIRYKMALQLAQASKTGQVFRPGFICENLGVDENTWSAHRAHLDGELEEVGMKIGEYHVREKRGIKRISYYKLPAFRLEWMDDADVESAEKSDSADLSGAFEFVGSLAEQGLIKQGQTPKIKQIIENHFKEINLVKAAQEVASRAPSNINVGAYQIVEILKMVLTENHVAHLNSSGVRSVVTYLTEAILKQQRKDFKNSSTADKKARGQRASQKKSSKTPTKKASESENTPAKKDSATEMRAIPDAPEIPADRLDFFTYLYEHKNLFEQSEQRIIWVLAADSQKGKAVHKPDLIERSKQSGKALNGVLGKAPDVLKKLGIDLMIYQGDFFRLHWNNEVEPKTESTKQKQPQVDKPTTTETKEKNSDLYKVLVKGGRPRELVGKTLEAVAPRSETHNRLKKKVRPSDDEVIVLFGHKAYAVKAEFLQIVR